MAHSVHKYNTVVGRRSPAAACMFKNGSVTYQNCTVNNALVNANVPRRTRTSVP